MVLRKKMTVVDEVVMTEEEEAELEAEIDACKL